jgi:biopolymer transport protein ExbD
MPSHRPLIPPRPVPSRVMNLAPMVDMLMCLVIFFLLAGRMSESRRESVRLPEAGGAHEASVHRGPCVVVRVVRAGPTAAHYAVDGQPVAAAELAERLNEMIPRDVAVGCVVRAERDLEYRHVEPVLASCAAAGIQRVTFATVRPEAP